MTAAGINETILSDLDAIQERLCERYMALESMALLRRRYGTRVGLRYALRDGALIVGAVMDRAGDDEAVLSYLLASINNLHLAFCTRELVIACDPILGGRIKERFVPESRILEIYGDSLKVNFLPLTSFDGLFRETGDPAGPEASLPRPSRERVVGVDIGGTKVKSILYDGSGILKQDIRETPILEAPSTERLIEELAELVGGLADSRTSAVGIAWPAPIVDGRIVTPIKIPALFKAEGLVRIAGLRELLGTRLGLPLTILNDGAAGALSIARMGNLVDTLCIGLGYSVSAGFIDARGKMNPQMELCAATLGFEGQRPVKVRDYLSLKFGVPAIAKSLGFTLSGKTSLEQAQSLVAMSIEEYTEEAAFVFTLLGMYLAEMIASAHGLLGMRSAAVFGGLTKNPLIVPSAERWLAKAHPDMPIRLINTKADNQFVNAIGAAISAMEN